MSIVLKIQEENDDALFLLQSGDSQGLLGAMTFSAGDEACHHYDALTLIRCYYDNRTFFCVLRTVLFVLAVDLRWLTVFSICVTYHQG